MLKLYFCTRRWSKTRSCPGATSCGRVHKLVCARQEIDQNLSTHNLSYDTANTCSYGRQNEQMNKLDCSNTALFRERAAQLTDSSGKCIPQFECDQWLLETSQEIFETATHNVDIMYQCLYTAHARHSHHHLVYTSTATNQLYAR